MLHRAWIEYCNIIHENSKKVLGGTHMQSLENIETSLS